MVVRAEVVHEVVDLGIRGMGSDMGREDPAKGVPIMIRGTLSVELSGCRIQEGEKIGGAISPIVKVLQSRLMRPCGQGGRETGKGLNAGALVETIQMLRGMGIALEDRFHFGKEIRIGDLEVVLAAMGPKGMVQENPMERGVAHRFRMFFGKPLCVTKGPPRDPWKGGSVLAVESNGPQPSGFGKVARPTRTLPIVQGVAFFDPAHPAADGSDVGRGENGNAPMIDAPEAQGNESGPLSNPFPEEAEAGRGRERILEREQPGLHELEPLVEVFFSAATNWGKERVISPSPNRDK